MEIHRRQFIGSVGAGVGVSVFGAADQLSSLPHEIERRPGMITGGELTLALRIALDLSRSSGWLRIDEDGGREDITVDIDAAEYEKENYGGFYPARVVVAAVMEALPEETLREFPNMYLLVRPYRYPWAERGKTVLEGEYRHNYPCWRLEKLFGFLNAHGMVPSVQDALFSIDAVLDLAKVLLEEKELPHYRALLDAVAAGKITEEMLKEPAVESATTP